MLDDDFVAWFFRFIVDNIGWKSGGTDVCAASFLNALFDAPREHWYPALVIVDEAQMFAPTGGGEVPEEIWFMF